MICRLLPGRLHFAARRIGTARHGTHGFVRRGGARNAATLAAEMRKGYSLAVMWLIVLLLLLLLLAFGGWSSDVDLETGEAVSCAWRELRYNTTNLRWRCAADKCVAEARCTVRRVQAGCVGCIPV